MYLSGKKESAIENVDDKVYVRNCVLNSVITFDDMQLMMYNEGKIGLYELVKVTDKEIIDVLSYARDYYKDKCQCLICKINEEEKSFSERVIMENDDFMAYLPYFTDYPYGIFIASKEHRNKMIDFTDREKNNFAEILKSVTGTFDCLFDRPFPYMMNIHQGPVNSPEYEGHEDYYHFHVEFYPPLRSKEKIKYYASSEMGAWAACNPASVEDTAAELREAYKRYLNKINCKEN